MAIDRDKIARNALRFIQKGQFQKAIDEYKKVLSGDPQDIRTRLKLIDLFGRAGKKQDAIDECLQVTEVYADQGFYLKAIAVYKQALRMDPENPLLYRNMGEMYVKQGLMGDALTAFKRGVDVLRRQGLTNEAEGLLLRMEEMAPENAAIKIHLAELFLEDGKYEAFEEELTKLILQLRGEGRSRKLLQAVEAFYERANHSPSVLIRLAELYVDLGEEEKAIDVIREGLGNDPGNRDLRLLSLRAYLALGEWAEGRRMALDLHEEDPDDLFILEQLAAIAQARGEKTELAQAYKAMANVYGRRGLQQKEETCYRQVLDLFPDDAEANISLGGVRLDAPLEPEPEPEGDLEAVAEAPPSEEDSLREGLVEAELYLKYGMEERAAEKLRELTDRAPHDLQVRQKLRDLYQRKGEHEGWVQEQLRIAEIFLRDKREEEALRAYQAVLEVNPSNGEAISGIRQLKPEAVPSRPADVEIELDGAMAELVEVDGEEQAVRQRESETSDEADAALVEGLSEADFFEAQGLVEEAATALSDLRERFPESLEVQTRLARLAPPEEIPAPEEEGFVDLQKEVLDAADQDLGRMEGFDDFEASELDDIVSEFKSGIAEHVEAGDHETHYNLGVAYREMELLEDAVQEFKLAAQSPERARDAHTSLALVYRDMGKREEAFGALREALALSGDAPSDRAAILHEMGVLAEEGEDWERALRFFEKVADTEPTHRGVESRIRRLRARMEG